MTDLTFADGHQSNHRQCNHHYCREAASCKIFTLFQLQEVSILQQHFMIQLSKVSDLRSIINCCCSHVVQHSEKCSLSTWRSTNSSSFLSKLLLSSGYHQMFVMIKVQILLQKGIQTLLEKT